MKLLRSICFAFIVGWIAATSGCSTSQLAGESGASNARYYSVATDNAGFYRYGPQQGNGPDQRLPRDTILTLIQSSFGYCKVRLMNGEQGYVASEDIHIASPALVAAVTAPPPSRISRFRLDSNDPRLSAPPEPLPVDIPEPTPIPGADSSPAP